MAPHAEEETVGTTRATVPTTDEVQPGVKKAPMTDLEAHAAVQWPRPPVFEDKYKERDYMKGRLAAAFRIFGKYGFDEGVAGHITLRDPVDPNCFWVNPFGKAFSLINKSDLIVCLAPCTIETAFAYVEIDTACQPRRRGD